MTIYNLKRARALITLFAGIFCAAVIASEYQPQWKPTPGTMLDALLFKSGGQIVSTDSLSWPDGSIAMVQYVKTRDSLFRCIDYQNKSFRETANLCYKLKKWDR